MLSPGGGTRLVATALGHRREFAERRMEKPSEPDAFPAPLPADTVHAIVPVARADQGKAVSSDGERPVKRAGAVLEKGPLLR